MHECLEPEYIEKLPKGKNSTKGIGRIQPDPAASKKLEGKIEVPLGKLRIDDTKKLAYNEYIVYEEAQLNIRYLSFPHFRITKTGPIVRDSLMQI